MIRDRAAGVLRAVPDRVAVVVLAVLAYVPMLLTRPGRVSADTKTYLTLAPGRLLDGAVSMWDPSVGAGTVPHQNIGYLFPLGPYYWAMDRLTVPDWVTQRLLWATMVFAAAYGTYRFARWLGWTAAASLVAGAAYGFSPYLLSYLARLSVILGPWAAMPWMLLFAAQAARTRSWRPAAWFAVTVALVGSVNATALVFAGLAPLIWLATDVVSGRITAGAAARAAGRIGVLCAGVSAWCLVGLGLQGSYGLPILLYTEAYQAVESASAGQEILRGLGYWFFYGGDRLDAWVGPSQPYVDNPVVIALGFLVAGLSLAGFLTAFSGRVTAAVLLLVGMIVSVGAAPLGRSTVYGTAFEWLATETTVGAALRSTPRAAPLVVLALALGLGAGTDALRTAIATRRWRVPALAVPAAAIALVMAQLFPWFTGTALTESLLRDEQLPPYVRSLAGWLDETGDGRVYALPGADFAAYRWGGTVDPVLPGLTDRPVLYRELVPQGGPGTADLLNAFERRLAEGWVEPEALPSVAELFAVETVVVRNDLEHERYRLARPGPVYAAVTEALGEPDHQGPDTADVTEIPLVDEQTLAHLDVPARLPAVAGFDVGDEPLVDARPAAAPVIVAGSGDGIIDLAGAELLDLERPLLYAATLADLRSDGVDVEELLGPDPWWIVTDTNRKQARRWSTIGSNLGALEAAGDLQFADDPGNSALDLFDDDLAEQTVAVHRGPVADVRATSYGNSFAYTPEDAPWFAIDGDPTTAWRGAVFDDPRGLVWEVDLREPVRTDAITILQPITGSVERFIVDAEITLLGEQRSTFTVTLDERSRAAPGQRIEIPAVEFSTLRLEVASDNRGPLASYVGAPGVGLAEVGIGLLRDDRVARLPSLAASGLAPGPEDRLTYVFTRQRIDPSTPNRDDPERTIRRQFDVPDTAAGRPFEVTGEVRLSAEAGDEVLARVLGERPVVVADRRLPGSVASRGAAAFDGDPTTAWQTPFGEQVGAQLTIDHGAPVRAEEVVVTWLADGRHSVPTVLAIANGADLWEVPLTGGRVDDGIGRAIVPIPGFEATTTTVSVTAVDVETSPNYFSGVPEQLPIGIVEIELGDVGPIEAPTAVASGCRNDLVTIDGRGIDVEIAGPATAIAAGGELALRTCGPLPPLDAGANSLSTAPGSATGFDVDRIVLDAATPSPGPTVAVSPVTLDSVGATAVDAALAPTDEPVWVTLRQSHNDGWELTVDGAAIGGPVLVDGYANGWLVGPSAETRVLEFRWTPQRAVRWSFVVSALFGLLVVGLLVASRRDRHTAALGPPARPPLVARDAGLLVALALTLALVAPPVVALTAPAAVLVRSRLRPIGAIVIAASLSVVVAGVIALQWRRDYSIGPDWPSRFAWASDLAWIAVGTIVALVLIPDDVRRNGRRTGRRTRRST